MKLNFKIFVAIILLSFLIIPQFIYAANPTLNLFSDVAIAVDGSNGSILYGKNIDKKVYPASTTKILTAILAIENLDLNKSVVVSKTAVVLPSGSSNVGLKAGEVISVENLLYCLLLNSGNDAANVLAEAVSGSIDKFVDLMNDKASFLNCTGTHFANAHGYHVSNHYTTANDMMKILNYAVKNETFTTITSAKEYVVAPTNLYTTSRKLQNTNRLILTKNESYLSRYYEYAIGGKTGYTPEAGRTLVTYGQKDGKFILVGIFASIPNSGVDTRYTDAINLFEYSFNNFNKILVAKKSEYSFSYINSQSNMRYNFSIPEDIYVLSTNSNTIQISYKITLDENTINKMDVSNYTVETNVGVIDFNVTLDSGVLTPHSELKLVSVEKISTITSSNFLGYIIFAFILLLLVIFMLSLFKVVNVKMKKSKCSYDKKYLQDINMDFKTPKRRKLRK